MFLTRSIRRKLVIGLGLVLLMLGILAVAGLTGLLSYRAVVQDLEFSLDHEPRRTDLSVACATLFDPLLDTTAPKRQNPDLIRIELTNPVEGTSKTTDWRQELDFHPDEWNTRMHRVYEELQEFRRRVDKKSVLRPSVEVRQSQAIILSKLDQVQRTLAHLEQERLRLTTSEFRESVLDSMLRDVARIQSVIQEIPNPDHGTERTLRAAPAVYKSRLWWIIGCLLCIPVLFGVLVRCGHYWIFVPVRKLHEAASRVANGYYNHRCKLRGRDEMVDLANVFNRMVERFQSDKADLDQQVKERSSQMVRSERLAGIGCLAAGIAHEINNPLSAIAMAADSLTERMAESGDQFGNSNEDRDLLRTYIGMIQRESVRCQQITRRTLDFARGGDGTRERHDLTKIVREVLNMTSHTGRFQQHQILFDGGRSHMLEINGPEIQQVIVNLVVNGLEAMETPGALTIKITEEFDEVVLTVTDTGCGMTPHVIANLYEPFFTEKLSTKGTGLGLSITNRIVGEHGGRIEASSDGPGKGSTFRVHLPRRAKEAAHAA